MSDRIDPAYLATAVEAVIHAGDVQMARNSVQPVQCPNENIADVNCSQSGIESVTACFCGRGAKLPCRKNLRTGKGQFITSRLFAIERIRVEPSARRAAVSKAPYDRIKKALKPIDEKSLVTIRPDFSCIRRL